MLVLIGVSERLDFCLFECAHDKTHIQMICCFLTVELVLC